jgi:AcrR family transcriptional regulator
VTPPAPPATPSAPAVRRGRPGYDVDRIVTVATVVFTERGYDATTMADLATALGLTKSAIYHHVAGKQELLARALGRALDALDAVVGRARASESSAMRTLQEAVRGAVRALIAELPSVTLLLRVRGNSDVERAALARRRAIDGAIAEIVAQAQRDGDLRQDLDPLLVARLIFGTVNSLVEWYPRSNPPGEAMADAVCALVFDGLRTHVDGPARNRS